MIRKVYIDTSVVGGVFDEEFEYWSKLFFEYVIGGKFKIAVSEHLINELSFAPEPVKSYLDSILDKNKEFIEFTSEAKVLAELYYTENILGPASLVDARHIATATVHNIDILTSWNFKHIVNLNKILQYNSVNLREGFRIIEIRTPREILDYEN
jgi:hypothetical protein